MASVLRLSPNYLYLFIIFLFIYRLITYLLTLSIQLIQIIARNALILVKINSY